MYTVLDTQMNPETNDAGAITVRDYLKKLLLLLWSEEEGFSSKRPFGNSGWQNEIYQAMAAAGISGTNAEKDKLILEAIEMEMSE